MSPNLDLVLDFCRAWSRRNTEEILSYFSDDAVYHNVPVEPLKGKEAIRGFLNQFFGMAEAVEFDILNTAESGNIVFTERVDRFRVGGKKVDLPVAGVFEVVDGKIVAWRDYFDVATWTRQTGQGAGS